MVVEQKGFELSAPFLVCQTTAKCSTVRLCDGLGFVATLTRQLMAPNRFGRIYQAMNSRRPCSP